MLGIVDLELQNTSRGKSSGSKMDMSSDVNTRLFTTPEPTNQKQASWRATKTVNEMLRSISRRHEGVVPADDRVRLYKGLEDGCDSTRAFRLASLASPRVESNYALGILASCIACAVQQGRGGVVGKPKSGESRTSSIVSVSVERFGRRPLSLSSPDPQRPPALPERQ
jgi:hypothetical protein